MFSEALSERRDGWLGLLPRFAICLCDVATMLKVTAAYVKEMIIKPNLSERLHTTFY